MILTKEQLNERLKERFGDTTEDDDISFLEDITDTFNSLESEDMANRIVALENELTEVKKKYRDRFFSKVEEQEENKEEYDDDADDKTPVKYEELFKEVEK